MAEPARDIGFGSRLFRLCVCLGQVEGCYLLCTQVLELPCYTICKLIEVKKRLKSTKRRDALFEFDF